MAIRFYVDADLLGLAKLLVAVRPDVTYPGDPGGTGPDGLSRPPCPVPPPETDSMWIPTVASQGWIAITRDRHLNSRPAEKEAIIRHRARVIRLDARHQLNKWLELEIVVCQWRRFEELLESDGPWVYLASRTALTRLKL